MATDPEEERRRAETIWRLVDTQCAQLAEAVAGARMPFLLALTWAFIWASALYRVEFSNNKYLDDYFRSLLRISKTVDSEAQKLKELRKEYQKAEKASKEDAIKAARQKIDEQEKKHIESKEQLAINCRDLSLASQVKSSIPIEYCRERIELYEAEYRKAHLEATTISLPGGFGKFSMGDLAFVGQFGLLLILSWCFFASRRENHAILAFVDMDDDTRKRNMWFPFEYTLVPKARFFLTEHFAYAYRAVAQRFVFLFSQHSRPLLAYTALLIVVPALVASWNAYTDIRDLVGLLQVRGGGIPVDVILFKVIVEVALLVFVWVISYHIIRYDLETSVLLNGWQMAVEQVWMANWETARLPPARVRINVPAQTATPIQAASPPAPSG